MGMHLMDLTRTDDGAELTVELIDGDASAEVLVETQPARVSITDAAEREIEVDIDGMLHQGVVIGEGLDLDDEPQTWTDHSSHQRDVPARSRRLLVER